MANKFRIIVLALALALLPTAQANTQKIKELTPREKEILRIRRKEINAPGKKIYVWVGQKNPNQNTCKGWDDCLAKGVIRQCTIGEPNCSVYNHVSPPTKKR